MTEPSEAAMREAKGIVKEWQSLPDQRLLFLTKTIARSLDRFAAAQREKDAQLLENLANLNVKFGLRPNAALLEAAAAIRSAASRRAQLGQQMDHKQ